MVAALIAASLFAVGCGDDDDDGGNAAPVGAATGPNADFLNTLGAACTEAYDQRALLPKPDPGDDTTPLANYLQQALEIEGTFRDKAKAQKVPAALRADMKAMLRTEAGLTRVIKKYENVARVNDEGFLKIIRRLQDESNPRIEKLNGIFKKMEVDACEAPKISELSQDR